MSAELPLYEKSCGSGRRVEGKYCFQQDCYECLGSQMKNSPEQWYVRARIQDLLVTIPEPAKRHHFPGKQVIRSAYFQALVGNFVGFSTLAAVLQT